jgi:hypothetical protein
MAISKEAAEAVLLEEAAKASGTEFDAGWVAQVERLSRACEDAPKTHIAYLGTAMLAKAVDLGVDVLALKAKSPIPGEPPPPGAFSARTLCHGVLVPHATELGINLGVTGREPLNNQPYFRMIRIDDGTPVHGNSRVAFAILREILDQLAQVQTEAEARAALRAFIRVRRQAQPDYAAMIEGAAVPVGVLVGMVATFVSSDSEGGKRAQAVAAGLLDVFAGKERVDAGRINDPSRHYPGDVVIYTTDGEGVIEKAFEVRDKPVAYSDILIFGQKALESDVREAAVVAVSLLQPEIDLTRVEAWAKERLMGLTVFVGWEAFIRQALFWSAIPEPLAAAAAMECIHVRLVEAEVSEEGVGRWAGLVGSLRSNR